ncbi:MAG: hypothetical protein V1818_01485 [Candidatus Aenigmatarchaeota archaeon]
MRNSLFIVGCFLLLICTAYAASVEVGISEVMEGKLISLSHDNATNIVKFSAEFYNTGSVPYKTRMKTEIIKGDETVFNGWSDEKDFMPGDKRMFETYWHATTSGAYSVKLKAYFGNEIKEYKKVDFVVGSVADSEDVFAIENFRTYDDYVLFDVVSNEDVENVIIMPSGYTAGWIFEQKTIDNLTKNSSKYVMIKYKPTLWSRSAVKMSIVSDDGKYYTEESLEMKKLEGLTGLYFYITDSIKYALFK